MSTYVTGICRVPASYDRTERNKSERKKKKKKKKRGDPGPSRDWRFEEQFLMIYDTNVIPKTQGSIMNQPEQPSSPLTIKKTPP